MRAAVSIRLLACFAVSIDAACAPPPVPRASTEVVPAETTTGPVPHDPDDPAIWVHPSDPRLSLILATDKEERTGGLHVFDLRGAQRQMLGPLDRPNNVDVEYQVASPRGPIDLAVVTERMRHRLRVFAVGTGDPAVVDLYPAGVPVLQGATDEAGEPMGIALYRRPRDGSLFAIVTPKSGGARNYLWQYRIEVRADGVVGSLVRRFGAFSGRGPAPGEPGEIEAVVVDDALGYVYYADERFGIHKWHADPDHPHATRELAVFGTEGYHGDREGLALYAGPDGTGYLVSVDQVPGGSRLFVYARNGSSDDRHRHALLRVISTGADATDGVDVTARSLPGFRDGLVVMMNSGPRNFLLFSWSALATSRR